MSSTSLAVHNSTIPTSRTCSHESCKNPSRTVCICCEKCYCYEHLTEHFGRINNQVPPLSDKIDGLAKRLTKFATLEPSYLIALEKWRDDAHKTVEEYYEKKRRDFIDDRHEKLKHEIQRVRNIIDRLLRKHNAVKEDVDLLTQDIKLIEQKFNELQSLHFNIQPLTIDENLITRDILPLSTSSCRTMKISMNEYPALANDDKYLLVHQSPDLSLFDRHFSLIKHVPWTHDEIWDMCWSTALSKFIIVTDKEVFTLDPSTMTITRSSITADVQWSRVTCSDSNLFLLTQGLGSSIYEYKFPLNNKGAKERHSPDTCEQSEHIFDIQANHKTLAMVIFNTETGKTRLDLRSTINFEHLWCIDVGQGYRCSLLYNDQWMVVDPLTQHLFHISNNGKLIRVERYLHPPWNVFQWGKYIIGIRTNDTINLH